MNNEKRLQILKIAAAGMVGLWLLNTVVIDPALLHWKEQRERIAALQEKVTRGRQLLSRKTQVDQRWAQMLKANLPAEVSAAENSAYTAMDRWARDSHIASPSKDPKWQSHDEGYETYECRVSATGDQAALGRFIYEMETDTLPVNLEDCELVARDNQGAQLTLSARVTFLRLKEAETSSRKLK